ncbi:PEP-CTERM sorting domain-containing protein [uncultured Paraglaciecola sp.]|uniref:PEP-CTERM sorting domain-containing protein n=1 Tax=uncultured Paraglaciecola sp. TaxID=1765024 RepID=UPI0026213F4E|nr:PEP-CTERM sorting domain-containing protein [uncultured Paraglaciecola sp.]
MKVVTRLVLAVSFLLVSTASSSAIISLTPTTQGAHTGDLISATVMISGLGQGTDFTLAGFNLDVGFDSSALSFVGYNLFGGLGENISTDPDDWLSDATDLSGGYDGAGSVNLYEISWLLDDALEAMQDASFALAEVFFTLDSTSGTTDLSLSVNELVAASGDGAAIPFTVQGASVTVPAPSTIMLMGLALVTLLVRRKV